jgi:phosphoribosyl-ATP pyrophosphohydrolase
MLKTLEDLVILGRKRRSSPIKNSYTNKLLENNLLVKEKVVEEINELIDAVEKDTNKIHEAADVFFHLIMYLEVNNIKIEDVMLELDKRKK